MSKPGLNIYGNKVSKNNYIKVKWEMSVIESCIKKLSFSPSMLFLPRETNLRQYDTNLQLLITITIVISIPTSS